MTSTAHSLKLQMLTVCTLLNTHPIGSAVALSCHGRQLSIQQVPGLVNALGEKQGSSRLGLCTWDFTEVICLTPIPVTKQNTNHGRTEFSLVWMAREGHYPVSHQRQQHTALTSRGSGDTLKLGGKEEGRVLWGRTAAFLHGKGMSLGTCLLCTFLDG